MLRLAQIVRRAAGGAVAAGLLSFGAQAQDRLSALRLDQLTPEQQTMATMLTTPPRNSQINTGPFNAYARSPGLGILLLQVSDYVRFNSSLPPRLSEFAILITSRQWTQQYEFSAHYPLAIKGGLDPKIANDLAAGKRPEGMKEDEAALYDFAMALYRDKNVTDEVYANTMAKLGEHGVVDAIAIMGYYDLVSMTLTTARAEPAKNGSPLLAPLTR